MQSATQEGTAVLNPYPPAVGAPAVQPGWAASTDRSDAAPIHPRISIQKLDVFCRVVQLGGVSLAADELHVSQPVVTRQVRALERQLGTELFDRSGPRRDKLTEAGQVVYAWAEDVLRRTRQVERDLVAISDESPGDVALGASMAVGTYALAALVTRFRQSHPGLTLRLDISSTEHAIEDVRDGTLDFALVELVDQDLGPTPLRVEAVGGDELVLVAAPGAEPAGATITPAELELLPLVEALEGSAQARYLDGQLRAAGVAQRNVVLRFGHPEAMKRAAAQGIGASFVTRTAAQEELAQGSLREIGVEGLALRIPISLVYHRDHAFSAAQTALLRELRQGFGPATAARSADVVNYA